MLKKALMLEKAKSGETQVDAISDFVVELFKEKFTRTEMEDGADISEVMAVFRAVLTIAENNIPNA